jgi:putative endonuclease
LALRYLVGLGYEPVERNYRTRYGEIDLILRDGGTLVFAEVKLRRGTAFGEPVEAVTGRKRETIRSVAGTYLADKEPQYEEVRFDVIGILAAGGRMRVRHVRDAF